MPVPPTSISAATITSQAMPIEIRMPVRMVGAAAGRMMVKARRNVPTSSVRATHQGRHPDQETGRNGDRDRQEIARHHARDRPGELDAQPLVVGTAVVERVLQ